MKYNLKNREECNAASTYLTEQVAKEATVEVKTIRPRRSLAQNAYFHLLLGYLGNHLGYNLEEMKTEFKRTIYPQLFTYTKNGKTFLRSSADLNNEEMTKSIDKLHEYGHGIDFPLPLATNKEWIMSIQNQLEKEGYEYR